MNFTPIPEKLKQEMEQEDFYKYCIFRHTKNPEWHHNLYYRGKRINAKFAILPLSKELHTESTQSVHKNATTRELCTYFCILRASSSDLKPYPRINWQQEFKYLDNKFKNDRRVEEFRGWCKTCDETLYR